MLKDKYISLSLMLLSIIIFPHLISQNLIGDDNYRFVNWLSNFQVDGRFIANYALSIFSGSKVFFLPTYPLGLIIDIFILYIIVTYFIKQYNLPLINYIIIPFCLCTNPFMLEPLSFKVDSFHMLLSIDFYLLAAILNIKSFISKYFRSYISYLLYFVFKFALLFCAIAMYQASLSIYVIATCCICFLLFYQKENFQKIFLFSLENIFYLICTYILYYFVINYDIEFIRYSQVNSILIFASSDFFGSFLKNIYDFLNIFYLFLNVNIYLYFLFILSQLCLFWIIFKIDQSFISKILIFFILISAFFCIFLHFSLFLYPVFAYRVLIGFGMFLCFCFIILTLIFKSEKFLLILFAPVVLIFAIQHYAFCNYTNYLTQKRDDILFNINNDIKNLEKEQKNITVYFAQSSEEYKNNNFLLDLHPILFRFPYNMNIGTILHDFHLLFAIYQRNLDFHFDISFELLYDDKNKYFYSSRVDLFGYDKVKPAQLVKIIYKNNYSILYDVSNKSYVVVLNGYDQHLSKALQSRKILNHDQEIYDSFNRTFQLGFDIYQNDGFIYLHSSCDNVEKWSKKKLRFYNPGEKLDVYKPLNLFIHRNKNNCIASVTIPSNLDQHNINVDFMLASMVLFSFEIK